MAMDAAFDYMERRRRPVVAALTAAIGYFLLAATTISLTSDGRNHATVWPADAVILALLLNAPRRHWPAILMAGWLGNLAANGVTRGWMVGLVLYGAINMGQVLLAAHCIRRGGRVANLLADMRTVGRFVLWAGLIAPVAGATIGSLVSLFNYGEPFGPSFLRWFASNALGLLVFTPFLKALFDGSYSRCFAARTKAQIAEAAALLLIHAAITGLVFWQSGLPILFLPFSSLLVLSFRLGRLGTHIGVMLVAVIGAVAGLHNAGAMNLIHEDAVFQAVFFQAYLAVMLATTLPVAAIVSSRSDVLASLAEREETLRIIMAHSPDVILSFDREGFCRWADGPLRECLGLDASDIVGQSLQDIADCINAALIDMHDTAANDMEARPVAEFSPLRCPTITLEASLRTLKRGGLPMGTVMTIRNVSSRKANEIAMSKLAETDDLTGVLNRGGFGRLLKAAQDDRYRATSLALIDVDHFKAINDTYGHQVGDVVLAEIARRLRAGTREADVVGRLGGDEFAILFRCDIATAKAACERIAQSVAREAVWQKGTLSVFSSISCGLAELHPGMSRDQLFDAADMALYEVKRAGRNGVQAAA